jgi:hypothetical protein
MDSSSIMQSNTIRLKSCAVSAQPCSVCAVQAAAVHCACEELAVVQVLPLGAAAVAAVLAPTAAVKRRSMMEYIHNATAAV